MKLFGIFIGLFIILLSFSLALSSDNYCKTVHGNNGFEMTVDYDRRIFTVNEKDIPITIDYPECHECKESVDTVKYHQRIKDFAAKNADARLYLEYDRFDIYADTGLYNNNTAQLELFIDKFEQRYEAMESLTKWSAEKFYGKKLEIYFEGVSDCGHGWALAGEAHIYINSDLSDHDACVLPYYEDGLPLYDNPGELGDQWTYMLTALHESLHSITPQPIFNRSWLREGLAEYHSRNILVAFNDINQETANYYIHQGSSVYYNWEDYVANDYHDTSIYGSDIQNSLGYDISAWMFTMLRENYGLNWSEFYDLLNNNHETLNKAHELDGGDHYSYFTDACIIDIFGRMCGMTFDEIQAVFRYDGPNGPGWGVRYWESLDWYADLTATIDYSTEYPLVNETIDLITTIYNSADFGLNTISVNIYNGGTPILIDTININALDSTIINIEFIPTETGGYTFTVIVDEENIKIESNDTNNMSEKTLTVYSDYICGDANSDAQANIGDAVFIINHVFKGGPAPGSFYAGNANCDDDINAGDAVYMINHVFKFGPAPCAGCE
ncbi:MAG: CARDB domain-containing protein [Candidatus Zixiibacteriota bacterium]